LKIKLAPKKETKNFAANITCFFAMLSTATPEEWKNTHRQRKMAKGLKLALAMV